MSSYTDADLTAYETLFEDAARLIADQDVYFEIVLALDPSGEIGNLIHARAERIEEARHAALTPEARAEEDEAAARWIERGMVIFREVLARHQHRPV